MPPRILLVNPWIYDFAAFDLWARPLGLLYLGAVLKKAGYDVRLVDCMDRLHPKACGLGARPGRFPGTGHWPREIVPTPAVLQEVPRRFARYGLPETAFLQALAAGPRPDLILMTSIMTYWYPGVQKAIELLRQTWPEVKTLLGGIYATLCPDHARKYSGADSVLSGPGETSLIEAVGEQVRQGEPASASSFKQNWLETWPALELYPCLEFASLMTSRGCPQRCPYCASATLYSAFVQRPVEDVLAEIEDRHLRLGLADFAFFDDALLIEAENHLMPILEGVLRRGFKISFHAPNGLHLGLIRPELARLMYESGFKTLRLGLETFNWDRQRAWGGKVEAGEFESAMKSLVEAGFEPRQIGVYLLYGLPGQPLDEVLHTVQTVKAAGARPYLAEFSPLPGTPMWEETKRQSPFDLESEPLYHNNTFFPCRGPDFSWEKIEEIKRAAVS
ncbi:MAG: B12-binding domain-containing radical SAM protein [Deltaproteobacteria bacterium]|nr:B12-binding domain-containing radical SAM protein [Deltaproteobacteria bacterium]MBW2087040.1 B12-binding domain-containing radical SAM protein [Deltaproteobacteria bacterium]